ncbi:MAG: 4-hydroxy-tetrahydrodipicolinate reductase [Candidatus Omnitrophica bacterium]|nr:4-hydroxy-tetrahydrodipicolinate reductase [Candidatus Omnitrophota bacterium]MDD5429562.1 4-hydroxy-tetrahydrodipicolinate reductase [Candidatus Omnitrophota bacterium]
MINLGINGARGKIGQRIMSLALADSNYGVSFGLERQGHPEIGKTISGVVITDDCEKISDCECFVDFTCPAATLNCLSYLVKYDKPVVIGTTGFDEEGRNRIAEASKNIPIVFSPNMSVGVNVLFKLLLQASEILKGYRVSIEEAHHVHKKDAPSGTAKEIARIINSKGLSVKPESIKSIREDEIIGDHKIIFKSDVDSLELCHSAKTRDIFVQGALVACSWVKDKCPGLYSMDNVLSQRISKV